MTSGTDTPDSETTSSVSSLTILVGSMAHTAQPWDVPVIFGRDDPGAAQPADIRIADPRISRRHLELTVRDGHWVGIDRDSTNGTFIDGERVHEFDIPEDGLTVHLGHPAVGISVHFSTLDPSIVYAGAAVAKRRQELNISQRKLAEMKVINAGTLIQFEKGRTWPRERTRESLEEMLGWPAGKIAQLRAEYSSGGTSVVAADPERTEMLSPSTVTGPSATAETTGSTGTIDTGYLGKWVEDSLARIRERIAELGSPDDKDYPQQVAPLIDELTRLESLVHSASGAPEVQMVFLHVRHELRDLMLRAAGSRHATPGQLLFAARDRARLSVEDAALMAGVAPGAVRAFEAGNTLTGPETDALTRLLASLR